MAVQRQRQFRGRHPLAIVADADQSHPAALDVDLDAARPGIQGVLEEFLHHRGGTLDHLTRGDLVNEFAGKYADCHAVRVYTAQRRGGA